jgi:hypothetical protein
MIIQASSSGDNASDDIPQKQTNFVDFSPQENYTNQEPAAIVIPYCKAYWSSNKEEG